MSWRNDVLNTCLMMLRVGLRLVLLLLHQTRLLRYKEKEKKIKDLLIFSHHHLFFAYYNSLEHKQLSYIYRSIIHSQHKWRTKALQSLSFTHLNYTHTEISFKLELETSSRQGNIIVICNRFNLLKSAAREKWNEMYMYETCLYALEPRPY